MVAPNGWKHREWIGFRADRQKELIVPAGDLLANGNEHLGCGRLGKTVIPHVGHHAHHLHPFPRRVIAKRDATAERASATEESSSRRLGHDGHQG